MDALSEREKVIGRLIANTRKKKRPDDLVEIARELRVAEKELGSMSAVSRAVGISSDMIRQFLSVEKVSPEVQALVKERKIDLVNIVHYMRNMDQVSQNRIAEEIRKGTLSANDVRVLAPLKQRFPTESVDNLINRVKRSKNVAVYVISFRVKQGTQGTDELDILSRFENIVGDSEVVDYKVDGQIATMEISELGRRRLLSEAKKRGLTVRNFAKQIISGWDAGR